MAAHQVADPLHRLLESPTAEVDRVERAVRTVPPGAFLPRDAFEAEQITAGMCRTAANCESQEFEGVTKAVDPIALEQARIAQVTAGFSPGQQGQRAIRPESMLDALSYVTFQELATRVSHRNTGRACAEPVADELLKRIAADENLHMIFYRGVAAAALDISPDQAVVSICRIVVNFQMPGFAIPNFRRNAVKIAVGGIYDLRQHLDDVIMPVLRKWRIFERDDFRGEGARRRDELAVFIKRMDADAAKFEESKARYLERENRKSARLNT